MGSGTASVSHRMLQRMPSNGGEFSGWLDRSAHIARQRVKMRKNLEMCDFGKKEACKKPHLHDVPTDDKYIVYTEKSA